MNIVHCIMSAVEVECELPMARVTIELPDRFVFSTRVPIYTSHINQSRHLDSVALLTLFAEARARMLAAFDYRRDQRRRSADRRGHRGRLPIRSVPRRNAAVRDRRRGFQ